MNKKIASILIFAAVIMTVCGCGNKNASGSKGEADFVTGSSSKVIRILSGSENKELEEILTECADETGVQLQVDYKGSIDIMRELQSGAADYDAVWPASSIWISLGDESHLVKHDASISLTPVVFGIRQSLAGELGFTGKEVSVKDILEAINADKMSFCMTSATQSNSGASAYIGFLYALLGKQDGLTAQDLKDPELQTGIKELLDGVERGSGSSDWLKELFLEKDYDAMVNYECLIIDANEQLVAEGKEPLQVIYPYDGLSIADSPLGYVDHGDSDKEEAFLSIQEYLLSSKAQQKIEATGRRINANTVSDENKKVFNSGWGVDTDRVLSPIQMPNAEVLMAVLNLYQTNFKKPSLNIYCLDFSGSMAGEGQQQLKEAMKQILVQDNARKNLLQANDGEVNIAILFDNTILEVYTAADDSDEALQTLYDQIAAYQTQNGTDIYTAAAKALEIASTYELDNYTPAIILMTDGMSRANQYIFTESYEELGYDIPVFSITFGDADPTQLDALAEQTGARVFDGTENLSDAFRSVKGYN